MNLDMERRPSGGGAARMIQRSAFTQTLMAKIQAFPHRLVEVEDFVDFIRLCEQHRALTHDVASASLPAFAAVWSNPEDDVYDAL